MTSAAFLRACLRLRHDPAGAQALCASLGEIEGGWESVCAASEAERVAPLLRRAIHGLGVVPPGVANALRRSQRAAGLRNLLLLDELGRCLQELAAARVPVVVLKGAALAEAVYRDVSLRPMCDVDLLVHHHDLATASRILRDLGYVAGRETHPGAVAEHENELVFSKAGRVDAQIDVHWSLFDSPYHQARIAMDWFWQSTEPVSVGGVPAQMLGPEALLIHLCGHLALHHMASGLLWWYDIVAVLESDGARIDWAEVLARTQQYALVLPVRAVLTRVVEEWGATIPAEALAAVRALPYSRAEERVFRWLTSPQRPARQRFWADLASMPGWRQRLRFGRTHLFPSAAYMRQRYRIAHPLLLPLYYPYRWLRGLRGAP
jgi:Uncharacterised nucleotidyltransferase